jgi:hypothetical protein
MGFRASKSSAPQGLPRLKDAATHNPQFHPHLIGAAAPSTAQMRFCSHFANRINRGLASENAEAGAISDDVKKARLIHLILLRKVTFRGSGVSPDAHCPMGNV